MPFYPKIKDLVKNVLLGSKDLMLKSTDPPLVVTSGTEVDFIDVTLDNNYTNYGYTRCRGNLRLMSNAKLRLRAGSVFRIKR